MTKPIRRIAASFFCLAFLAETTGAADLAMFAAGRMPPAAFPPAAVRAPAPQAAPKTAPPAEKRSWSKAMKGKAGAWAAWAEKRLREFEGEGRAELVVRFAAPPAVPAETAAIAAPPVDRMLIARDPEFAGVADAISVVEAELARTFNARAWSRTVMRARQEEKSVAAPGLRLRVAYLDSYGLTWGDAKGFHVRIPGRKPLDIRSRVPAVYRREFALYFAGDEARYEIEIENTGSATLENAVVYAQQENFNPKGGVGAAIHGSRLSAIPVGRLTPGERKVLSHSFVLGRATTSALISFEQTHLSVRAEKNGRDQLLMDAPQAGIVDPPGN